MAIVPKKIREPSGAFETTRTTIALRYAMPAATMTRLRGMEARGMSRRLDGARARSSDRPS